MIVVADATPLIALAKIRKFFLLKDLFGELLIPKAVYEEVVDSGKGRPGQKEVEVSSWIKTQVVGDNLAVSALETMLGRGEA